MISGALVSVGGIILLLAFDHLKSSLAFRNKKFADVQRSNQVTLLSMRRTCFMLDASEELMMSAHGELRLSVQTHAAELQVRRAALDTSIAAYNNEVDGLEQLLKSIKK